MSEYRIHDWNQIKAGFREKLLLGNGASRAVWSEFKYSSLYKEARRANKIDARLAKLFSDLATEDFEYVLRLLSQTGRVNDLLGIEEEETSALYEELRNALIDTVRAIHPQHRQVKSQLIRMAEFMMRFDTVLSLNYDLLAYWAMLEGKDEHGNWLKDCFTHEGRFEVNYEALREPYNADGATLVFYPHGSLILATMLLGDEVKLSRVVDEEYVLDRILETWREEDCIPLFVSEGETSKKLRAIKRSDYLRIVYTSEVDTKEDSLVIYGWSFGDQDEHILRGIIRGGTPRMAISVHMASGKSQEFCRKTEEKIRDMEESVNSERKRQRKKEHEPCEICFFRSDSDGVWNR